MVLPRFQVPGIQKPLAIPQRFAGGLPAYLPPRQTMSRGLADNSGAGGAGQQEGNEVWVVDDATGEGQWVTNIRDAAGDPVLPQTHAVAPQADPNAGAQGSANAPELNVTPGTEIREEAPKAPPKTERVHVGSDRESATAQQRSGGQVIKVPGGWREMTRTGQPGANISKESKELLQQEPRLKGDEVMLTGREHVLDMKRQQLGEYDQLLTQQRDLDKEKMNRVDVDRRIRGLQRISDQRTAEAEATPLKTFQQVYDDRSTFAKITGVIASAAAGYVAGVKGGENMYLKNLRETIQAEVDSQKAKWEAARATKNDAKNDFSEAVQLYGTPEAAELDLTNRYLANASAQAKNLASKSDQTAYMQKMMAFADEVDGLRAAKKAQTDQFLNGQILQNTYANIPDRYVGMGAGTHKRPEGPLRVRLPEKYASAAPNGLGYLINDDPMTARKVQDDLGSLNNARSLTMRAKRLADEGSNWTPDERKAEYESINSQLEIKTAIRGGQGGISEGDGQRIKNVLGDSYNMLHNNATKLNAVLKTYDQDEYQLMRDYVTVDPDGQVPLINAGETEGGFDEQAD